ncbi:hypothetical protein B9Z19DRAFT_1125204 [Tuber borchii]|uniref:OTU domain-containing protein n=1 Tax=Tuber borchii TaxID=42251 RepID=A0A2T6ZVG2_TUBBO|nr:hypothetical protein B9Z19DRAFT_1125204 [Tuber borchii]
MSYSDEFLLLEGVGLYTSDTSGDGHCLFHALSNQVLLLFMHYKWKVGIVYRFMVRQLYVHEKNHLEIWEKVVEYMRNNASYFKPFLDIGTTWSAPKRNEVYTNNNKGNKNTAVTAALRTESTIDIPFTQHRSTTHQFGTKTDRAGPPNISPLPFTEKGRKEQERRLANSSYVQPWMVEVVISNLPYLVDSQKIQDVMEEGKGNIDAAFSKLLDAEEGGQAESEQQQEQEGEKKEHANKSEDLREKEEVDKTLGEEERIEETEAEKADTQGYSETQENIDKVNNLAVDTNSVKAAKRSTPKIGTRGSARIRAREDSRSNLGSGPENSGSAAKETRKQQPLRPKKETYRERKGIQKAAAKQRKKGNALSNKETEL